VPRALVVNDDAMVYVAAEARLQRHIFEATGFAATIGGDHREADARTFQAATCDGTPIDFFRSPDLPEMILEPRATFRLRKPFTPNAPSAAPNRCLAKSIANARIAQ
jgi:hypothetical protein